MRNARVADHWRRLYERKRPERLSSFVVRRPFFPSEAEIADLLPFTVICGGNGAGKTSVLAILYSCLTADASVLSPHLRQGTVELTLHDRATAWTYSCDLANVAASHPPRPLPFDDIRWLDVARESAAARRRFVEEPDLDELLAQFGARRFDEQQLALARYVTRKNYSRVTVTMVEDDLAVSGLDDEEEPATVAAATPHFEVEEEGRVYDTRTMGAGELACVSLLWGLFNAPPKSLLLIEEPETYVSPTSQRQLLNVMAKVADERKLFVILSTHSVEMLHLVPPEAIRIIESVEDALQVRTPLTLHEVQFAIGSGPAPAKLVIVEDRLAAVVLHELLAGSRVLPALGANVVSAGSNTNAVASAKLFKNLTPPLNAVAVVDGDQRNVLDSCLFLPGANAPEAELIDAITLKKRAFATRVGRLEGDVATALQFVKGQDPHEAWYELWNRLNSNSDALARAAVQVWMTVPGVKPSVKALVAAITKALM